MGEAPIALTAFATSAIVTLLATVKTTGLVFRMVSNKDKFIVILQFDNGVKQ
ncbi:hypothetical protein FD35_GL000231 [Furfurilactobacillus rossiae DSM 15814]|uniref:Uncharacterized protein n=1 Tax=Furfurilactobacillus rossiae DSM 15814 TaxID=1114972 RepID=A0A0R1RKC5_9LACO|nr:hypothetical protein FD35_GL000231 [Furfurilactobacillus rossiae DSM 15814]